MFSSLFRFALVPLTTTMSFVFALSMLSVANGQVVVLGASNAAGKGVGAQERFSTQLESGLRAHGRNVRVTNAGVSGDTTSGMLGRLDTSVPRGTRAVVLETAPRNDARAGLSAAQHAANVSEIVRRLRARGIRTIVMHRTHVMAGHQLQADGVHVNAQGHAAIAARLTPRVGSALGH